MSQSADSILYFAFANLLPFIEEGRYFEFVFLGEPIGFAISRLFLPQTDRPRKCFLRVDGFQKCFTTTFLRALLRILGTLPAHLMLDEMVMEEWQALLFRMGTLRAHRFCLRDGNVCCSEW